MWYTIRDFQEANMLFDSCYHHLEEETDHKPLGLKWYRGLVMPHTKYPSMDNCHNANWLHIIPPSVLPGCHETPAPPPSPDWSKRLPLRTTAMKGKEKDYRNVGGLLLDLADAGSEDRTSIPAKKEAGTILLALAVKEVSTNLPAPTEAGSYTLLPAHSERAGSTNPPALTHTEASTTPEKSSNSKEMGTP